MIGPFEITAPAYPGVNDAPYEYLASIGMKPEILVNCCAKKATVTGLASRQNINIRFEDGAVSLDVPVWIHTDVGARKRLIKEKTAILPSGYFEDAALMFPFPEGIYNVTLNPEILALVYTDPKTQEKQTVCVFHILQNVTSDFPFSKSPFRTYRMYVQFHIKKLNGFTLAREEKHYLYDMLNNSIANIPTCNSEGVPSLPFFLAEDLTDVGKITRFVGEGLADAALVPLTVDVTGDYVHGDYPDEDWNYDPSNDYVYEHSIVSPWPNLVQDYTLTSKGYGGLYSLTTSLSVVSYPFMGGAHTTTISNDTWDGSYPVVYSDDYILLGVYLNDWSTPRSISLSYANGHTFSTLTTGDFSGSHYTITVSYPGSLTSDTSNTTNTIWTETIESTYQGAVKNYTLTLLGLWENTVTYSYAGNSWLSTGDAYWHRINHVDLQMIAVPGNFFCDMFLHSRYALAEKVTEHAVRITVANNASETVEYSRIHELVATPEAAMLFINGNSLIKTTALETYIYDKINTYILEAVGTDAFMDTFSTTFSVHFIPYDIREGLLTAGE